MSDLDRLDALRRRVQKDPASLAFAPLAEEYRRAGRHEDAIRVCRDGLGRHPSYLSARVTLGRALLATGELEAAAAEFQAVLDAAPDNLAALRGLAEIHQQHARTDETLSDGQAYTLAPQPELDPVVVGFEAGSAPRSPEGSTPRPPEQSELPALVALEAWLEAIVADREGRRPRLG